MNFFFFKLFKLIINFFFKKYNNSQVNLNEVTEIEEQKPFFFKNNEINMRDFDPDIIDLESFLSKSYSLKDVLSLGSFYKKRILNDGYSFDTHVIDRVYPYKEVTSQSLTDFLSYLNKFQNLSIINNIKKKIQFHSSQLDSAYDILLEEKSVESYTNFLNILNQTSFQLKKYVNLGIFSDYSPNSPVYYLSQSPYDMPPYYIDPIFGELANSSLIIKNGIQPGNGFMEYDITSKINILHPQFVGKLEQISQYDNFLSLTSFASNGDFAYIPIFMLFT